MLSALHSHALARKMLRGAERLSGYVYRHALASDMKADGATREQIAMALGHAVTKTQDTYGRAVGVVLENVYSPLQQLVVKVTHDPRFTSTPNIPAPNTQTWDTPGFSAP